MQCSGNWPKGGGGEVELSGQLRCGDAENEGWVCLVGLSQGGQSAVDLS